MHRPPEDLDALDIRVLRELAQGTYLFPMVPGLGISYRRMGKKVGASEGTVRNRVAKMRSSGLVRGSKIVPNPGILGLELGTYGMDTSNSLDKAKVVSQLRLVDGTAVVQNHHGRFVGLVFLYEDGESLARKLELYRKIGGADDGLFARVVFPPCSVSLKGSDWRVIDYLIRRGPGKTSHAAADLHLSSWGLRRKLALLTQGRAIFTQLDIDFTRLINSVAVDFIVQYVSADARSNSEPKIMTLLGDYMFYTGIWEGVGVYSLFLPNTSVATTLAVRIRQFSGVKMARAELVDEHFDQFEVFGGYVQREMRHKRSS
jgi:DNA-binding Lrp family transcriptional regulator